MAGARGEGIIEAGGREVRVLFTNRALADFERQTEKSIIGATQGFLDGRSGMTELAHLLRAGMEAARRDAREPGRVIHLKEAYQVLDQVGFGAVMQVVLEAVSAVLGYNAENEDESAQDESEKNANSASGN